MSSKDQLCVLEKFVPGELSYTEGWGIDLAQEPLDGSVNIAALTSFFRSMKAVFSCSIVTGPVLSGLFIAGRDPWQARHPEDT